MFLNSSMLSEKLLLDGKSLAIRNCSGGPPCPPILGEPNAFSPRIGGQGGAPGAIETILTAWLSSYRHSLKGTDVFSSSCNYHIAQDETLCVTRVPIALISNRTLTQECGKPQRRRHGAKTNTVSYAISGRSSKRMAPQARSDLWRSSSVACGQ